jgi:hypothetical protein
MMGRAGRALPAGRSATRDFLVPPRHPLSELAATDVDTIDRLPDVY